MIGSAIARNYSTKIVERASKSLISRELGRYLIACYHPRMRRSIAVVALMVTVWAAPWPALAADPLSEARRLYNLGEYEAAERAAREAVRVTATTDSAHVVLGRILLERYRRSADAADLGSARESLRMANATLLDARDRVELALGVAEALFLEERFGAAAELFDSLVDRAAVLGAPARERVLDWWATSVDRQAQVRAPAERTLLYQRVLERMASELAQDPGSTPASYWIAAAARGSGDLDRAWNAALAAWVRAPLARDRGATLRGDVDRLVMQAIAPERAQRLSARDTKQALAGMLGEWETFKQAWSR
jgi:tetratricopeptide (TPR) repeat protein